MIKINNIHFSYQDEIKVLTDINLSIKKGTWTSIIGHNGSGKSTLAKLLVGLIEAKSGEIYVDDLLLNEENLVNIRKKIGIVFQNPDNQFVGVTVKHDVAFGLENQQLSVAEMKQRINKYLTVVDMQDFLNKEPHQLSGGQKQRVAIAGSLAMEQDILILDEATSMLDPKGTKEIVDIIRKLNKEQGKTIITITHDLAFAGLSDQLVVLKEGKIILNGEPKEVFSHEALLQSSNLELPMTMKLYHDLGESPQAQAIKEALWTLNTNL